MDRFRRDLLKNSGGVQENEHVCKRYRKPEIPKELYALQLACMTDAEKAWELAANDETSLDCSKAVKNQACT